MDTLKKANEILGTDYNNWVNLSEHKNLTEDFIREFQNKVDWSYISSHQHLSEPFIREFKDKVRWSCISIFQHLTEPFIREFKDKVAWHYISAYQHLTEPFIREFQDEVGWGFMSVYQHLSENFIREFKDKLDWRLISEYQHLSEPFIREFQNKVDWYCISGYQKLSEDFIREFQDKVNWENISQRQKLSESFIREFKDKLVTGLIDTSWLYKDTNFKKQVIKDCGLYECHEDYFIAYKAIRGDRYSKYNFQYKYEPGQTYECWCDCSAVENSFGLSVWTEDKAKEYGNGLNDIVVKVKVKYEDVGRLVHNGGKIRCFKIEVLN